MKLNVLKLDGSKPSQIKADESVFGIKPNEPVIRQAVLAELTNLRQGTHSTKNRASVAGGGRKPWRQKGRGVARAGTIRSPLWRGGGRVFGPEPHSYNKKLSKKLSKLARKSVLSSKIANNEIVIVEKFQIDSHKTSNFVSLLKNLGIHKKKLTVLISDLDKKIEWSTQNLRYVYIVNASKASTYDLLDCEILLMDKDSLLVLTTMLKV
ncbi:MAG: 50S ribosomal protein L4 [Candidatus Marinimicrobia bacterium]|nr:50S ribosomal protein L4 [Candidatus Neomarinimicrobiota bacterium]|tara:strand:+ start:2890 stop:3516 length:627 start_codon:yes stop_codon:yes gene_type:complete